MQRNVQEQEEQVSSLCYICMNEEHTEALVDSPCSCHHRKVHISCLINMIQCRHSFQCPVCTSRFTGLELHVTYRIDMLRTMKNTFLLFLSTMSVVLGSFGWIHRHRLGRFDNIGMDVCIGIFIGIGTIGSVFVMCTCCIFDTLFGSFFVYYKVVRVRRSSPPRTENIIISV